MLLDLFAMACDAVGPELTGIVIGAVVAVPCVVFIFKPVSVK